MWWDVRWSELLCCKFRYLSHTQISFMLTLLQKLKLLGREVEDSNITTRIRTYMNKFRLQNWFSDCLENKSFGIWDDFCCWCCLLLLFHDQNGFWFCASTRDIFIFWMKIYLAKNVKSSAVMTANFSETEMIINYWNLGWKIEKTSDVDL